MIWKGTGAGWGEQPRCTQRLPERLEVALPQAGRLGSVAPDLLATGMSGGQREAPTRRRDAAEQSADPDGASRFWKLEHTGSDSIGAFATGRPPRRGQEGASNDSRSYQPEVQLGFGTSRRRCGSPGVYGGRAQAVLNIKRTAPTRQCSRQRSHGRPGRAYLGTTGPTTQYLRRELWPPTAWMCFTRVPPRIRYMWTNTLATRVLGRVGDDSRASCHS